MMLYTFVGGLSTPPLKSVDPYLKKILDLLEYYKLSLKAQAIFLERIQ